MSLSAKIETAAQQGSILASTKANLLAWTEGGHLPAWALQAVTELVDGGHWEELNNRFYQTLAFGTGGLRGRTIGQRPASPEAGELATGGAPARPAVGSACMNDFNVVRATLGLYRYCAAWLARTGSSEKPSIVLAHDVRHFSRHFCELSASVWTRLGGSAYLYEGPRSTPQLSFSIRHLKTTTGAVVTASHNPPHDNGFKVYFNDGAQVISPNAELIVKEVNAVSFAEVCSQLEKNLDAVSTLPPSLDEAYLKALEENILDANVIATVKPKLVFTAIHGTGGVASLPALQRLGAEVITVPEQTAFDGRFPTVKSPNPENAEALAYALRRADETGADLVLATDPDSDRMGAAARCADGKLHLLSGNLIGSLLAEYRLQRMKDLGLIPANPGDSVALIKTFVTTELASRIATRHNVKVVNTLTGFKYFGAKLRFYEEKARAAHFAATGQALDWGSSSPAARRELAMKYSTFFVLGFEESYGYLASDLVRDKDANAAVLMFTELFAALKAKGKTLLQQLDELFIRHGYFAESQINIVYEGASGAAKIRNILDSYRKNPPKNIDEYTVTKFTDFGAQEVRDSDGHIIPPETFFLIELDNGYRYAVRGSGTEPKIKFYLFAQEDVPEPAALPAAKAAAAETLAELKTVIEADARMRAE